MIKHDDYFSLVKNNTLMFAKAESSSNSNFLDSENNYKIFVVCKIELLGAEYRLTVNNQDNQDNSEDIINRIHEYICKFNIFQYTYFMIGFDKPTRTYNYATTGSLFHIDQFTPNANGNNSEIVRLFKIIVPINTSDISILKYATNRDICSVQAFIMESANEGKADSIRTKVCNGDVIYMAQKYNVSELPHSIPFITDYEPTTSIYSKQYNRYDFYSGLREKGDLMLADLSSLGERVVIRTQVKDLSETQYESLIQLLTLQSVVQKLIVQNNSVVYDYDTYVSDKTLRSKYEIGGGNKKSKKMKCKKLVCRRMKRTNKRKHAIKKKRQPVCI